MPRLVLRAFLSFRAHPLISTTNLIFRPPLRAGSLIPAILAPRNPCTATMSTLGAQKKHKIAVIGSGNWGSAIAKIVSENAREHPDVFEPDVQMWVFEEKYELPKGSKHYNPSSPLCQGPQPLSQMVNTFHENVKYLPGIALPKNLHANPSLRDAARDATILVFNLPHQFIEKLCDDLAGQIVPYARGISCIKGVSVSADEISLFSDVIGQKLGIYCGALSGANIASEVAEEKFSETTIAYDPPASDSHAPTPKSAGSGASSPARSKAPDLTALTPMTDFDKLNSSKPSGPTLHLTPVPAEYPALDHRTLKKLFHRPYFHARVVADVAAVSLCGALKNVVALAAGFVTGLGWGDNAKAAIMRVGLLEMTRFAQAFFPGRGVKSETFTEESAGVADLITSCSGGRNFRCARMAVEERRDIRDIERRELNGQILQGLGTAEEVHAFLEARGREEDFPLMDGVWKVLNGHARAEDLPELLEPTRQSHGDLTKKARKKA